MYQLMHKVHLRQVAHAGRVETHLTPELFNRLTIYRPHAVVLYHIVHWTTRVVARIMHTVYYKTGSHEVLRFPAHAKHI